MYSLNEAKVKKTLSLAMLYVKGDFYLEEYVSALKSAMELAMPSSSLEQVTTYSGKDNIFENYAENDFSYLKGLAILIPAAEIKDSAKTDNVIKLLHPYYS